MSQQDIEKLQAERDAYLKDIQIMCRIGIDFAAVFGVVDANDNMKQMSDSERVSTIFKTLTRLMTVDYPGTLMPGAIGKKNMEALKQKFLFLQAIQPMVTKYKPCSRTDLKAVIDSIQ